jgi:hypothetical protein
MTTNKLVFNQKNDPYYYQDTLMYKTIMPSEESNQFKKDMIKATPDFSLKPVQSIDIVRNKYNAEVYEKDGKYIYNFWEITDRELDPIFISVFRDTSKFGKRFVPELNCWSYVVKGFADNPFAASLKMKVFEKLDDVLEQHTRVND